MARFAREAPHTESVALRLLAVALTAWAALSCAGGSPSSTGVVAPPADAQALPPGTAAAGERLFSGAVRFANGGPPCLSCHDVAGLPFPRGGVLGPDLTGSWAKYGPLALAPVLNTLYFPTMVPIFTTRPLTSAERGDLAAFLQAEAGRVAPAGTTGELLAVAALGAVVLLVLAWRAWPRRLRGVRRKLLERVGRPEELRS